MTAKKTTARKSVPVMRTDCGVTYLPEALPVFSGVATAEGNVATYLRKLVTGKVWTPTVQEAARETNRVARLMVVNKRSEHDACRIVSLKGWSATCKGDDTFRTENEHKAVKAADQWFNRLLIELGLTNQSKSGGAREGAGRKRESETAVKPTNAPSVTPVETGKADNTAKAEPAIVVAPVVKTKKTAAQWVDEARVLFHALPEKNPETMGTPEMKAHIARIETELQAMYNLLNK